MAKRIDELPTSKLRVLREVVIGKEMAMAIDKELDKRCKKHEVLNDIYFS